jgi:hypothetical protein
MNFEICFDTAVQLDITAAPDVPRNQNCQNKKIGAAGLHYICQHCLAPVPWQASGWPQVVVHVWGCSAVSLTGHSDFSGVPPFLLPSLQGVAPPVYDDRWCRDTKAPHPGLGVGVCHIHDMVMLQGFVVPEGPHVSGSLLQNKKIVATAFKGTISYKPYGCILDSWQPVICNAVPHWHQTSFPSAATC